MEYKNFISNIEQKILAYPNDWREGQKVFNAVEELYGGVARVVQFRDGIDCFYNDRVINLFIDTVWRRMKDDDN